MTKTLSLLLLFISSISFGQKSKGPAFDIADFNKKMEVAEWLYAYDQVAWKTSDSVMQQDPKEIERLGSDWFCFQENDSWHAVYGKYEHAVFDLVFHFIMDEQGAVRRTSESIDTSVLHPYARALQTAGAQMATLKDTVRLRFNQFIKKNEDHTFSVWIFPAFQPNSYAIYGGEFVYTLDPSGTSILQDDSYYQGQFRGFKVDNPREIWLNYRETEKPTLGAVFFAWYYKSYFTKIIIDNAKSQSTPFKSGNTWTWIHVEKSLDKQKKKK